TPVGAAIVNVFPFMQLRRDGASVMCARQKSGKSEIVLAPLAFIATDENILHALEQRRVDDRLVNALIFESLPAEKAQIEAVLQDGFQIRAVDEKPGFCTHS